MSLPRRALGLALLAAPRLARASEAVTLHVGAAAGSGIDIAARALATPMGAALGATMLVLNRPSAGGVLAAEAVAHARPDGLNLLYSSIAPLAITPHMVRQPSYHPVADFTHIARLACSGCAVAVPQASPARDIHALAELLRRKGEAATFGTTMGTAAMHLAAELWLRALGTRATHVAYRSSAEVALALESGQLDFAVDLRAPLELRPGVIRLVAMTCESPDPGAPEVPLLRTTWPGVVLEAWTGVSAPRGLAPALVARLQQAAATALEDPSLRQLMQRTGARPLWQDSAAYTRFVAAEHERMGPLVRGAGLSMG